MQISQHNLAAEGVGQEQWFRLAESYQLGVAAWEASTGFELRLRLMLDDAEVAAGWVAWTASPMSVHVRETRGGAIVRVGFAREHDAGRDAMARPDYWTLRFLQGQREEGAATVTVLERCSGAAARPVHSTWTFPGGDAVSHRQLVADHDDVRRFGVRLGAFSQHGQLLNLRDWVIWQDEKRCGGLVAIRPGKWSHPQCSMARVVGTGDAIAGRGSGRPGSEIDMGFLAEPLKRSYLLVTAPTDTALSESSPAEDATGLARRPYAAWPASLIARHGFARRERLEHYRHQTLRSPLPRPDEFLFGGSSALQQAFSRVKRSPELAGNDAFWCGRFGEAADAALKVLTRFRDALCAGAYLHPLGNPVACRALVPAAVRYHALDHMGKLSDVQRSEGAVLIATLAHLLARRDTYPWHSCHDRPEFPYDPYGHSRSVYRGMLNQNFHTDYYAFVGLAGCVLPTHPRAAHWRWHAVRMFREQMSAFVWPDTEGYAYWEESHTYANHVKLTLLPLLLALRDMPSDEAIDLLNAPDDPASAKFRAMCRGMLPLLSPPEPARDGRRAIAAIGDHGYLHKGGYGFLFGYLASVFSGDREAYLWAWRQCGCPPPQVGDRFLSPLLMPNPDAEPRDASPPGLPALLRLEGFGASARRGLGAAKESLLLVRCGDAWGHHHPEQGSFWWWHEGVLVACDADMGAGEYKLQHRGHNVLGVKGFEPIQHLDRHGFAVRSAQALPDGGVEVDCHIPILGERVTSAFDRALSKERQGLHRRRFAWTADGCLAISDRIEAGLDGLLEWRLWCPAEAFAPGGSHSFIAQLNDGRRLVVHCPEPPMHAEFVRSGATAGLWLTYSQRDLRHVLRIESA